MKRTGGEKTALVFWKCFLKLKWIWSFPFETPICCLLFWLCQQKKIADFLLRVELFFTYAQTSLIQIARGIRSFRITEYFKDQFLNTSKSLEQGSVTKTKDNSWNGVLLPFSVSLPIPFPQSIARLEGLRSRSQSGTITLAPILRDSWCRAECWCPKWTSVPIVVEELSSYRVPFLGIICSE